MAGNTLSRVIKGLSQISVARIEGLNEIPVAAEVPALFTIANGIEETITETRSAQAEKVRGNIFVSGKMPDLNLTVGSGKDNPFWHELLFGNVYEAATQTVPFTEVFFVPPGTGNYVRPAASSIAYKRFGLQADDVVTVAYLGALAAGDVPKLTISSVGVGAPLEQVDYVPGVPEDNTDPLNVIPAVPAGGAVDLADGEYMIGDSGEQVFGPSFRGQSIQLNWEEPNTRVIRQSARTSGFFHIIMEVLDDENTIEIFDFQRVKPNVTGKTYDPSAETWDIGFYVTPFPGQCLPFQHYYTNLGLEC